MRKLDLKLNNWEIEQDTRHTWHTWLWHRCHNPLQARYSARYICYRNYKDKDWYCIGCGETAPQEIQDVADLAGCD